MKDLKPNSIISRFVVYGMVACQTLFIGSGLAHANIAPPLSLKIRPAPPVTCDKKFGKALVLAGGGINPGVMLGMLAAATASGNKPDVVISTCGSSIVGAIANAYPNDPDGALQFLKSREFHKYLMHTVRVGNTSPLKVGQKLVESFGANKHMLPLVHSNNVMRIPDVMPPILKNQAFTEAKGETRFVTVAARNIYGKEHEGQLLRQGNMYKQVFFTDPDTAKAFKNLPASIRKNFPDAPIDPETEVRTDVSTIQAARASISDPFLVNPAKIGKDYYSAGAMDLFPVESAQAVACDVTVTGVSGEYTKMEDLAVEKGFGFSQSARTQQLYGYKNVRWLPTKGASKFGMDPDVSGLSFVNKIPSSYEAYVAKIEEQYQFGFDRGMKGYGKSPYQQTAVSLKTGQAASR